MNSNAKERKTAAAQAPTQEIPTTTVKVSKKESKKEKAVPEYRTDVWVDALWDSYSAAVSQIFKWLESSEDAFLQAVKETNRWNGKFRSHLGDLKDVAQPNNSNAYNLVNNLFFYWKKEDDQVQEKLDELDNLLQDVTRKLTELTWNPWKLASDFASNMEKQWEENLSEWVNALRNQRQIVASLTEQYISLGKNNHRTFLRTIEDRFRPLSIE